MEIMLLSAEKKASYDAIGVYQQTATRLTNEIGLIQWSSYIIYFLRFAVYKRTLWVLPMLS